MKITTFLAALFFASMAAAQPRELANAEIELQRLIQDPGLKHGSVAFAAVNLDNGKVIAEHNTYKAMIPASLQKLITTGVALQNLGSNFQYTTTIGHTGQIQEGTLHGDLVIIAKGDPTLQSRFFGDKNRIFEIKAALDKAGIKALNGRILIDLRHYTEYTTPAGWVWEDMGNYFGASPTALMWRDNMMTIGLRSGQVGTPAMLANPWPENSRYELDIDIKAANNNKDSAWFFSAPNTTIIYGTGTIPAHKTLFEVKISNPDPVQTFAEELQKACGLNANEVRMIHDNVVIDNVVPLLTMNSVPLFALARITNHHSVNLFAEALLLELDTSDHYKSVVGGTSAIMRYLHDKKIKTSGLRINDGSGASPLNRLTAQAMVDFLSIQYRNKDSFSTFYESLPIGGQSGSVKTYFKSPELAGKLHIKSGTMKGVRNYAGYAKNKYDETIAFCLMMNDYDENRRSEIMQKVALLMQAVITD